MFEAVRKGSGVTWQSVLRPAWQDPAARMLNVDLLAILIAVLLPWSTTGVGIAVPLWIVAFGFTVEPRSLLRSLTRPVCALPIAFFVLALLGTLWSDAPLAGTHPRHRPAREISGAAAPDLSFRTLHPRFLGVHRLSCFLRGLDAGDLGRCD